MFIEVEQAGFFELKNYDKVSLDYLLGAYCPTILFPYACKVVANLIIDAGFPALHLPPVSFEQLYRQKQQKATETEKSLPVVSKAMESNELNTVQ